MIGGTTLYPAIYEEFSESIVVVSLDWLTINFASRVFAHGLEIIQPNLVDMILIGKILHT